VSLEHLLGGVHRCHEPGAAAVALHGAVLGHHGAQRRLELFDPVPRVGSIRCRVSA
jgi:hypothetical protein